MRPPTPTPLPTLPPFPSLRVRGHSASLPPLVVPPLQRRDAPSPALAPPHPLVPAPHEINARVDSNGTAKRKRGRPSKRPASANANANASGGNGSTPTRKPAYLAQKEVREQVDEEVRRLEARVDELRLQAGLPTKKDRQEVTQKAVRNAEIDLKIHSNRRQFVQLKSEVMKELQLPSPNPLASYIHLPRDMNERRAILRGLEAVKLRRAAETGIERFRHLDATQPYMSEERFTTEDGAYHCNRWEMIAFPQFKSAKQMYDVMLFWMYNMEISVTEMVNQVAVREDNGEEDTERTIWNHRIVATTEDIGVPEEVNTVSFAQFYESYDLLDGAPLGVITCDTVDVDDLYPYRPHERTRKDVQSLYLFREIVDPHTQRKSIVFQLGVFNAQLPPQFPVEPHVLEKLHAYMSRWVVLKNQYLSEYTVPP